MLKRISTNKNITEITSFRYDTIFNDQFDINCLILEEIKTLSTNYNDLMNNMESRKTDINLHKISKELNESLSRTLLCYINW